MKNRVGLVHVYKNRFIMEYIKKENGHVWLVKEHDVYGRHKTISYLGKEFVETETNVDKPKKKRKGED
jgi:hypothetical protein